MYQKQTLQKQYERCLQKLAHLKQPVLKTGSVVSAATWLALSASAQSSSCDSFRVAYKSSPIEKIQSKYHNCGNPNFVDIDGDGDYDCYETYNDFVNGSNIAYVLFLRNTGTKEIPSYVVDTASGFAPSFSYPINEFVGSIDGLRFADMDGDGDYDCILPVAYGADTKLRYYENTGTSKKIALTQRTGTANPFNFVGGDNADGLRFSIADLDNDGDFDLVTSVMYNQRFYVNTGTKKKASFRLYSSEHDATAWPYAFYDWNKDSLLDEFTKSNLYFKNTGTAKAPVYTQSSGGPVLQPGSTSILQFVDINNDGFIDIFDYTGNFLTTSPDSYILYDSTKSNTLRAYPRVAGSTFRWLRNGKVIAGATGNSYTPTQTGSYVAQITGKCGTNASVPTTVYTIMPFVKATNEDMLTQNAAGSLSGNSVKAYPNPFTRSFVMQLPAATALSNTVIRVTDIQGKVAEIQKPNSYTVSVGASLVKGVYMVQVISDKGIVYQQKMVKN